jgi:xylulokinase
MPSVFCGIDVGTQGARCLLVRDDGEPLAHAERAFAEEAAPLPEGWFEQEPGSWVRAVAQAVREAAGRLEAAEPFPDHVAALSVAGTSGTLCALDAGRRPLSPAIMYNDARSRAEAEEVQRAGAALAGRLGYRFRSSFALPKALWLKQQRPEVYRQVDLLLSPTDYVIGWLTGNWERSDQTNALKWGYDLVHDCWPDFIEQQLGIPTALLPDVQVPGTLAGRLARERAEELGLPAGLPVAAGMTDGCASQLAAGAVRPGQYNTTLGTTMVIKGVSERLVLDPAGRVYCHRHPAGWWLPGGASNTGAGCLAAEFGPEETAERSARALQVSPTPLVAYPLVGKGERFPFAAPDAEGFLLGEPAGRDELFAACLEGVACLERLAYETLEELGARVGGTILTSGGGAVSDAWLQIRADVLGKPAGAVAGGPASGAAMGAAILAAALEEYDGVVEAADAMVRLAREARPRPERADAYAEKYRRFTAECRRRGYLPEPWPA